MSPSFSGKGGGVKNGIFPLIQSFNTIFATVERSASPPFVENNNLIMSWKKKIKKCTFNNFPDLTASFDRKSSESSNSGTP